ncbi:hypothetical protein OTU49_013500, partial [Cherax quadricarinatus]
TTASDDHLQSLQHRRHLKLFTGCLTDGGLRMLQQCQQLRWLSLAVVSDDHAVCLLPQLYQIVTSTLHQLNSLNVRVSATAVSAAALTKLPSTEVMLELTDVSDDIVEDACVLAQKLQPTGG